MAFSNQYLMLSLNSICTIKSTIMFTDWFVVFNLVSLVVLYGLREEFSWSRITFQLSIFFFENYLVFESNTIFTK